MNVKLAKWLSLSGSLLAASCVLEAGVARRLPDGRLSGTRGKVTAKIEALNRPLVPSMKDTGPQQMFQSKQQTSQMVKTVPEQFGVENIENPDEIDRQLRQVDTALRMVYAKMDTLHRDLSKVRNSAQKKQIRQELKKFQKGAAQLAEKRRKLQAQRENLSCVPLSDVAFSDVSVPYLANDTEDVQDTLLANDAPAQMNGVPPPPPPPPPPPNWNPTVKASMSSDVPSVPALEPKNKNSVPHTGVGMSHLEEIKNGSFALKKVFKPTPLQEEYWKRNEPCWKEIRSTCFPGISFADENSFWAAVMARRVGFVETHRLSSEKPFADLDGKSGIKFTFVKGSKISAEAFAYTDRSVKVKFCDGSVAYFASDGQTMTDFELPKGVQEELPTNVGPQSNSWSGDILRPNGNVNDPRSAPKPLAPRSNSLNAASAPVSHDDHLALIRKGVKLRKVDRSGGDAKKTQPSATKNMSEAEMLTSASVNRGLEDSDLAEYCDSFETLEGRLKKIDSARYSLSINALDQLVRLTEWADSAPENSLNAFEKIQSELEKCVQALRAQKEQLKNTPAIKNAFEKVFGKNNEAGSLEAFQKHINDTIKGLEDEDDGDW